MRCIACALALSLLCATRVLADVGPPVEVRWSGDWPTPARRGEETVGRFEIVAGEAAVLDQVRLEGDGWTVRAFDAPGRLTLPRGERRVLTFRAVPTHPDAPLIVTGTANGVPFRKEFRLSADYLARRGRPGTVRALTAPILSGTKPGPRMGAQSIRIHGRFMYDRQGTLVGGDNVVVRVMDSDPISDEEIGRFLTDSQGNFDQTLSWDDCDLSGCDAPDIYVVYEVANLVTDVRDDDGDLWEWQSSEFTDFGGNDLDLGIQTPDGNDQAVHIFNAIIRAHRYAQSAGTLTGALTSARWPSSQTSGAFYSQSLNQIHIATSEEWNESTIAHEYGHRLTAQFSVLSTPNYNNGWCDTPTPGHCVWCPENPTDAWQEGFGDWFGGIVIRNWGYPDAPLSVNDNRYVLENVLTCSDNNFYATASTEGFVGAMLRDIEDTTNEDDDANPGDNDCQRDVLGMGAGVIFQIFDENVTSITQFLANFRAENPTRDWDLWPTIQNVAPSLNFSQPSPQVAVDTKPCRLARPGETVSFTVAGRGTLDKYQWRKNGLALFGFTNPTITIGPIAPGHAGVFDCVISSCDGTLSTLTTPVQLTVTGAPLPSQMVSWGENGAAQVGDGTTTYGAAFHAHSGLNDVIAVDGGRSFSMLLRYNGRVMTWGTEGYGELGNGGFDNNQVTWPSDINVTEGVRIAAGKTHGLALLKDGTISSWGYNFYGALFTGDFNHRGVPGPTQTLACVKDIAASEFCSYALLTDGTVRSVGYNGYGSLGIGTTSGVYAAAQTVVGLTNVIDIDAAGLWVAALRADSTVWVWGINTWGQLGLGHYNAVATPTQVPGLSSIKQIAAGVDNLYALRSDGTLFATGYGPALGIGWTGGSSSVPQQVPLTGVQFIDGGSDYAMAVMSDKRLKAWGLNAGSYPGIKGLFATEGPYTVPSPVDIPGIAQVSTFGAGWGTAHAFGYLGTDDADPVDGGLPAVLALAATPNPARAVQSIAFDLPKGGRAAISVYDVAGRRVRTIADDMFAPGHYVRTWDGTTEAGVHARAGVYFVRLSSPGGEMSRSIVRLD